MLNEIKTQSGKVTLYFEESKVKYSYALTCFDIDVDDDVQTLTLISNSPNLKGSADPLGSVLLSLIFNILFNRCL